MKNQLQYCYASLARCRFQRLVTLLIVYFAAAIFTTANAKGSNPKDLTQQLIQSLGGPFTAVEQARDDAQQVLNTILTNNAMESANISIVIANNSTANAWAIGSIENGSIVLYRGLLALLSDNSQLEAAIAHELAHLQRQDRGGHRRLIIERRADELASIWLGSSCGLTGLFQALSSATEMDKDQQHFDERRNHLTPANCSTQPLPKSLQDIRDSEPAYRRYNSALSKAASGSDVSATAQQLTELHPNEAKFWLLLGDTLSSETPCEYYQQATMANPSWFLPWLKLGSCQQKAGIGGSTALQKSISLLPTAEAKRLLTTP